jgi:hypothetical protein
MKTWSGMSTMVARTVLRFLPHRVYLLTVMYRAVSSASVLASVERAARLIDPFLVEESAT